MKTIQPTFGLRARLGPLALLAISSVVALLPGGPPAAAAFPGLNGRIAFSRTVGSSAEIFVMDPDGASQTQLTSNSTLDGGPSWSPDGTAIAFFRADASTPLNREIWVMGADGSGQVQLTTAGRRNEDPAWSPDGSRIVFWSDRDGDAEIFVMNADGSGQTQLTFNGFADAYPSWSPDGSKIAYASAQDGNFEIFVMNADGSGPTQLTFTEFVSNFHPKWSPDGSMIAFSRSDQGAGIGGIWIANADGSGATQLTAGVVDGFPAWSPDGTEIAFRATGIGIAVMNADGTTVTPLTSTPSDAAPDWQPLVGPIFPAVDLSLTLTAKPKVVVKAGKSLVYTITVSNVGTGGASGVVVADDLDAATTFVAATTTHGACAPETQSSGATRVRCELGVLPAGDSAIVHVTVEPTRPKTTVSNSAFVSAINPDATVSNNSATVRTKVQ